MSSRLPKTKFMGVPQARIVDKKRAAGEVLHILAGIPLAIKVSKWNTQTKFSSESIFRTIYASKHCQQLLVRLSVPRGLHAIIIV